MTSDIVVAYKTIIISYLRNKKIKLARIDVGRSETDERRPVPELVDYDHSDGVGIQKAVTSFRATLYRIVCPKVQNLRMSKGLTLHFQKVPQSLSSLRRMTATKRGT